MRTRLIGVALFGLAFLGSSSVAMASLPRPLYRAESQAQRYLASGLKGWARLNLRRVNNKTAFCVNGFDPEPELSEHYRQGRLNRTGQPVYRSFACTLVTGTQTLGLYLVTTREGWRVTALN